MENIYWNNKGAHQAEFDRLIKLMPGMGAADTVAGELIRSANRLAYDLYNNGMGNNTSGAVNFLLANGAIDKQTHSTIYDYTRGMLYDGRYEGDFLQMAMESMVDQTVLHILANPQLETQPNSEDLFDYSEEDQNWCDECGDEVDSRWTAVCRHCEEAYYDEEEDDCYA